MLRKKKKKKMEEGGGHLFHLNKGDVKLGTGGGRGMVRIKPSQNEAEVRDGGRWEIFYNII